MDTAIYDGHEQATADIKKHTPNIIADKSKISTEQNIKVYLNGKEVSFSNPIINYGGNTYRGLWKFTKRRRTIENKFL